MPYVNGYLGKLTRDPILKQTQSGSQNCVFTVASDKGWGDNKKTDFIPCIAWNKIANTIYNNFEKGDSIIVQGEWENKTWKKDERGHNIPNWQYIVQSIVFVPNTRRKAVQKDFTPESEIEYTSLEVENNEHNIANAVTEDNLSSFAPMSDDIDDLPF